VDWNHDERAKALTQFVADVARMRRAFPILRPERFLTGTYNAALDIKELTWLAPTGEEMTADKTYLAQQIATRTGISEADAQSVLMT
jgi:glycogen operon protein